MKRIIALTLLFTISCASVSPIQQFSGMGIDYKKKVDVPLYLSLIHI